MPPAKLESRPSDVPLTPEVIACIKLFRDLKRKPDFDKFPDYLKLRSYERREGICRQGDAGWTAFYFLTSQDQLCIRERILAAAPEGEAKKVLQAKVQELTDRLKRVAGPDGVDPTPVASIQLTVGRSSASRRRGWIRQAIRNWFRPPPPAINVTQAAISLDGVREIDAETLQGFLQEGELFGEKSCLYGDPRPGAVSAARDCYVVEMNRNILEKIKDDPAYKERTNETKKRIFDLQVRKLSLFAELAEEQFNAIRDQLELVTIPPGTVIYDEYERADAMYVILSGLVKVVKKGSALLQGRHIRDWPNLCQAIREGERQTDTPRAKIWQLLTDDARSWCRLASNSPKVAPGERLDILHALNRIIANRGLAEAPEMKSILVSTAVQEALEHYPARRKEWNDQQVRRFNRLLLEHVFQEQIRTHRPRVGPDCVLYYANQGEFIGEIGLARGGPETTTPRTRIFGRAIRQPSGSPPSKGAAREIRVRADLEEPTRSETAFAFSHPNISGDPIPLEAVRIPLAVLKQLMATVPTVREKVERKLAERKKQSQQLLREPAYNDTRHVQRSKLFTELGLIQGQKLMLIDLDRCTRCDECVRACVDTHDDGRSRLFLDGPRFGKYLVPTTCRACLDPVCMIGCPVGSIHRGHNGQIVIEDWCIGCGLCAKQCEYGSIQMHDIGVIAENARGWRLMPLEAVDAAAWMQPATNDRHWQEGTGPFERCAAFKDQVARHMKPPAQLSESKLSLSQRSMVKIARNNPGLISTHVGQVVCFRYAFELPSNMVQATNRYKMEVTSTDPEATVWINGQEVTATGKAKKGLREYFIHPRGASEAKSAAPVAVPVQAVLRAGRNVVAVRLNPDVGETDMVPIAILKLRLDEIIKPTVAVAEAEDVIQKPVEERAVVCDLCSAQAGQVPACVNACPHDAAMRIDARTNFPER
jgi:Fe-S-cluster-containing hydrogenase component 2/CRP-like cAMP-binding protein